MGYLLHLVTIAELLTIAMLFYYWQDNWTALRIVAMIMLSVLPLFAQLDARSRYQNYKLVKDQLYMFGFQKRILKPFIKSRCQRDAVFTACAELGYGNLCVDFFRAAGYRWYHVLPDAVLNDPMVVFTKAFIRTTLFVKTYQSRFSVDGEARRIQKLKVIMKPSRYSTPS